MAYFDCIVGGSGKGNTLVVTCASEFAGETITLSKTGKTYTKTCPSTSPYTVTFYGIEAGTYTVSATVSGETYSETVIVQDISAVLNYGFNWQAWVDASVDLDSTDYSTLADVLADEEAVRELFTVHDCVDYMASVTSADANVTAILNDNYAAKWINLRDYALDTLYANAALAAVMDTADKYFYGEWVITDNTTTPPTWGAKGNVPVMASNSAPYGTAISNGTDGTAYNAFDNNDSTQSSNSSYGTSGGQRLGYKFANPVNVKKLHHASGAGATDTIKVQYSDDGTTWTDTGDTFTNTASISGGKDVDVTDSGYHLYWAIYCTGSTITSRMSTRTLQFYGRELSASVPVMTSNTTPYGEASCSSYLSNGYNAFNAFDNALTMGWLPNSSDSFGNAYVQFEFPSKVSVKKFYINKHISDTVTFKVKASNDGTFTDIGDITDNLVVDGSNNVWKSFDVNSNNAKYFRAVFVDSTNPNHDITGGSGYDIQFFGVDYSEKEFEEGTTKKWLYDHGLELEPIENTALLGTLTKGTDSMTLTTPSSGVSRISTSNAIDITSYSLERMKLGKIVTLYSDSYTCSLGLSGTRDTVSLKGYANSLKALLPNNVGLNISSVNESAYPWIYTSNFAVTCEITEWWLE